MIVPDDLRFRHMQKDIDRFRGTEGNLKTHSRFLAATGTGFIIRATGQRPMDIYFANRYVIPKYIPSSQTNFLIDRIVDASKADHPSALYIPMPIALVSLYSIAGYLSQHWSPNQVALEHMAASELNIAASQLGGKKQQLDRMSYFFLWEPTR